MCSIFFSSHQLRFGAKSVASAQHGKRHLFPLVMWKGQILISITDIFVIYHKEKFSLINHKICLWLNEDFFPCDLPQTFPSLKCYMSEYFVINCKKKIMAPVSCIMSFVSCLLSLVSCLMSHISCLTPPVSCLMSPIYMQNLKSILLWRYTEEHTLRILFFLQKCRKVLLHSNISITRSVRVISDILHVWFPK